MNAGACNLVQAWTRNGVEVGFRSGCGFQGRGSAGDASFRPDLRSSPGLQPGPTPHAAAAAFHLRTRQTTLSTIVIRASSHVLALRAGLFSLGRRKGGCRRSHLLPLHQHMRGEKAMLTQARAGTGGALMSLTGCSRGVAATHLCLARFVGRSISWETSGGQTRSTVPAEDKRGRRTPADPNCLRKTLRRRSKINV